MSIEDQNSPAAQIMQDPAGASDTAPTPLILAPEGTPEDAKKLLNELPGLVGAMDHALRDVVGKPLPFAVVVFHPVGAIHASNMAPDIAISAVIQFAEAMKAGPEPVASASASIPQ